MKLLSEIIVSRASGNASIQLLQGDLSAIPEEHSVDILVMSAFPGDYIALQGSLIRALTDKGLKVQDLALDKETDLRNQLNCWLSKPLPAAGQQKFQFKKILCFEPGDKINTPGEVVGNIFRCINTFAFDEDNDVIAMPIIATGYQRVPVKKMLPALLETAVFWLKNGLPLACIKLVTHSDANTNEALEIFNGFKKDLFKSTIIHPLPVAPPPAPQASPDDRFQPEMAGDEAMADDEPPPPKKSGYDYFLSYAHKNAAAVNAFVEQLKQCDNDLNVFYDKDSIPPGGLWIQQISGAIQKAEKVIVFLSPDYDNSPVCWDEFQCAKLLEYNRKKNVIQTVYLYGHKETEMPLIMGIYSYIDCREGDTDKITNCVRQLLQ